MKTVIETIQIKLNKLETNLVWAKSGVKYSKLESERDKYLKYKENIIKAIGEHKKAIGEHKKAIYQLTK
jgi:hypothetical protein